MPILTVTDIARAPAREKPGKWDALEALLGQLHAGHCVLIEPDAGESPKGMRRGLRPVAQRFDLSLRRDPDGVRIWLVPKAPPADPSRAANAEAQAQGTPRPLAASRPPANGAAAR